ncbi:MAG: diguanylate cyclase [Thermoleophilia bacterium]|nr:diguanylate cyclase [Thermoleophilia bacterium]
MNTPIDLHQLHSGHGPAWQRAARRVRVLSHLQVTTLVAVGLLMIAGSLAIGRQIVSSQSAHARVTHAQLELISAREVFQALENDAWFAAANDGPRGTGLPTGWIRRAVSLSGRFTRLAEDAATISGGAGRAAGEARLRLARVEEATRVPTGVSARDAREAAHRIRIRSTEFNQAVDGWVAAYSRELRRIDDDQEAFTRRVLVLFAIAVAVLCLAGACCWVALNRSRGRVVQEMRRAVSEQSALRRAATEIASLSDTGEILDVMAREVAGVLGVERASVVRFAGAEGRIAGSSVDGEDRGSVLPEDGADVVAVVRRTGAAATVSDYAEVAGDPTVRRLVEAGTRSALAAPIHVDGAVWGALVAGSAVPGRFTGADVERLERFCSLAGLAVTSAENIARLSDQAASDPLTGLANHRVFRERLAVEAERARRHGRELALAVFDIDRFKLVNEALGHRGGDAVLVDLGQRLAAACRDGDLVARVGGEEFAWIMPETDSWGAWCAAERIRVEVAGTPLAGLGHHSVSAGVCDLAQAGGEGDRLYELADGAVYWAKAHGRDLCVRYSPDVVVDLSAAERATRLEQRRTLDAVRLLAQAVDARDPNTQRHSERVAEIAAELAQAMGWDHERIELLREAALVHDVGKIGVPDSVLLKAGPLTPDERERIQAHAALGAQMVADMLSAEQVAWVRGHHERWDGGGYPDGIAGEQISDGAQVLIVADAFDAMSADRPYRRGLPLPDAYREVLDGSGSQFTPAVVTAMTAVMDSGRVAAILEAAATTQPAARPGDDHGPAAR